MRSYRDLPLRWAELGTVYRYEKSGVLHGLLRVRGFTQDDAHIICTPEQIEDEIRERPALLALHAGRPSASRTSRPTSPRARRRPWASPTRWEQATDVAAKAVAEGRGLAYEVDEGGGAFYGPKIDLKIKDAHRPRVADDHHPVRLQPARALRHGATSAQDGQQHRPYMVHRALLGSHRALLRRPHRALRAAPSPSGSRRCRPMLIPMTEAQAEYAAEVARRTQAQARRARGRGRSRREARSQDPRGADAEDPVHARRGRRRKWRRSSVAVRSACERQDVMGAMPVTRFRRTIAERK